jgi:hypothetical protein
MIKRLMLLAAIALQFALFSTVRANATDPPDPGCFPCAM